MVEKGRGSTDDVVVGWVVQVKTNEEGDVKLQDSHWELVCVQFIERESV